MAGISKIDRQVKENRASKFGISFPGNILPQIDAIRGDTPRSLWLRRLAIDELERQKKNKETKNNEGS